MSRCGCKRLSFSGEASPRHWNLAAKRAAGFDPGNRVGLNAETQRSSRQLQALRAFSVSFASSFFPSIGYSDFIQAGVVHFWRCWV